MKRAAIALLLLTRSALAEPTDSERALATALFKEGKALMSEGKYAEACPKLEQSQRLDPGGGTVLNLALCRENEGRTATAWTLFHEALALANRDGRTDRRELAEAHIASLEPLIARLRVVASAEITITIDGVAIPTPARGSAMPFDPGDHVIEASAKGKVPWTTKAVARAGETVSVEIPALAPAPTEVLPKEVLPPPAPAKAFIDVSPPPRAHTGAWIAVSISAVAFGAAAYFSLRATSARRASDDLCTRGCTDEGVGHNERAKSLADAATVSVALGAAALAASVVLYAWEPHPGTKVAFAPARLTVHF